MEVTKILENNFSSRIRNFHLNIYHRIKQIKQTVLQLITVNEYRKRQRIKQIHKNSFNLLVNIQNSFYLLNSVINEITVKIRVIIY